MKFYAFILVTLSSTFSMSCAFGMVENSSADEYRLPQMSIDEYKKELFELQKLQRDNEKLKLKERNLSLKEKIQSLDFTEPETTKIVNIYSSRKASGGFFAEIYNSYDGIKTVEPGSYIMEKFKVVKITPTSVLIKKKDAPSSEKNEIELKLITLGGK
ncbi:TPA: hypothetical protein J1556_002662 [Escherichia coli]|nr:hypothetical protein [Escherichia coli]HBA6952244.1 hypothetical protein [Escherichia coli]HBA7008767.1 hypothetical protein [Escherichia coli]HBA7959813.1 hypothetical protein [Escherichia coli]HBA8247385.1 hypothetical protein [Escherichia coli]